MVSAHESDAIYFHTPGKHASAYPYKLQTAGKALITPRSGQTRRRFHEHVLVLTTAGAGLIELQDREFVATKGTVSWLDTSMKYAHGCHPDAPEWGYVWVGIQGYGLDAVLEFLQARSNPLFRPDNFMFVRETFDEFARCLHDRKPVADSHCSAVVAQLIAAMVVDRRTQQDIELGADPLALLFQKIRADVAHSWSVDELAKFCNISASQLHRKFKRRVGTTPMDWLRHERMNIAKRYLVESSEQISAVARKCGYADPYHFSRDFRRVAGMAPSKFRQYWVE